MCGVFGFLGEERDGRLGVALIRRRGPDRLSFWEDRAAQIWLGHARLSIQDLSAAGDQPMHDPAGRFTIVYNGEIYNAPELRAELLAAGETFAGHSDTEVFLRLFAREGTACFAKLNGIFAAAVWDREEGQLTLVRDALGVKPIYIDRRGGGLAFSSEMKALLRTHPEAPQVNRVAVLRHLVYLWSPGRETIAEGIEKLLPGEFLTRRLDGAETRGSFADWSLPSGLKRQTSPAEAASEIARLVDQAVGRQLLSDVPVGAFLSGGLDSSAVVAFAAARRPGADRMKCFSIEITGEAAVESGFVEDLPYARRVAEHLNLDLHVVGVGPEMTDRLAELIYFLDEPNADPAPLNSLIIAELARSHGIKVMLSGTGGDDVMTGYRRHFALRQERFWTWLPRPVRTLMRKATAVLPRRHPLARRIAKAFENADLACDERIIGYFQWLDPRRAADLLADCSTRRINADEAAAPLRESLARAGENLLPLDRMLYLERRHFLTDHNLNYTDKTGMAAGVEIRVPLLDPDLIAYADTLPDDLRQRGTVGKWIFKRAMEPFLPRDVIYRPKAGFGAPLRQWLEGPLRPLVDAILAEDAIVRRGLFDAREVSKIVRATREGRIDATYSIFAILCVELWCQQFIDGNHAVDADIEKLKVNVDCVR